MASLRPVSAVPLEHLEISSSFLLLLPILRLPFSAAAAVAGEEEEEEEEPGLCWIWT